MKLYEFIGKELFNLYQIPTPRGILLNKHDDIANFLHSNNEYILKAQTKDGGRGKRGLIQRVKTKEEAINKSKEIFQMTTEKIDHLLMEEKIDIEKELYFSLSIDSLNGKFRIAFSDSGGINVEDSHNKGNKTLNIFHFNILEGLKEYQIISLLIKSNIDPKYYKQIVPIIHNAYQLMIDVDATLVEINPLAITKEKEVLAIDSKIEIDDHSIPRNYLLKEFISLGKYKQIVSQYFMKENQEKHGISFVELGGDIAILSGGAGMTMAIIDGIHYHGGSAANFVDISSGSGIDSIKNMTNLIINNANKNKHIKCILLNIIISGTPLDVVTSAMVSEIKKANSTLPIIGCVKAAGLSTFNISLNESHEKFKQAGVQLFPNINDAILEALYISKRE